MKCKQSYTKQAPGETKIDYSLSSGLKIDYSKRKTDTFKGIIKNIISNLF